MEENQNELYDLFLKCRRNKTLQPYWLSSKTSLIANKISIIDSYETEQMRWPKWLYESYEESERKLFYLYKRNGEGKNILDVENEKLLTRRCFSLANIAKTYDIKSMELNPDFYLLEIYSIRKPSIDEFANGAPENQLVIRTHQLTHVVFSEDSFSINSKRQSNVVIYALSENPRIYSEGYRQNGKQSFRPLATKVPLLPLSIPPIEEALSSRFPIYKDVLRESPKHFPTALHDLLLYPTKKNFFESFYKKSLEYIPSNKLSLDQNYILRVLKPWIFPEDFSKMEMYFKQHPHVSLDYSTRKYKLETIKEICFAYLLSKEGLNSENLTDEQSDQYYDLLTDLIDMSLDYKPRPKQQIKLPNSLSQAKRFHDRLAKEERLRLRNLHQKEFDFTLDTSERFQKLAESLETVNDFYLFKKGIELIDEGEEMGNCIGGYVWRHREGDCFVCRYTDNGENIDLEFVISKRKTKKPKYILAQAYKKYNRTLESNQKEKLQSLLKSFKAINIDTSILNVQVS